MLKNHKKIELNQRWDLRFRIFKIIFWNFYK